VATRRGGVSERLALVMVLLTALVAAPSAQAQTYKVIYNFTDGSDGAAPSSPLIRDSAGNFYGTVQQGGGSSSCGGVGCGTVFKIDTHGKETLLYGFSGGEDGGNPAGRLILSGNTLYGTTVLGGSSACYEGCGVVFALSLKTGAETVLYRFKGNKDGAAPGGVVRDVAGNLYGTTAVGGDRNCDQVRGCGVVFKLDTKGKLTVLHTFHYSDGAYPGGLTSDTTGKVLYGPAAGGASGYGVVFSLTIKTAAFAVLYNFTGGADGGGSGPLSVDKRGIIYGTTDSGGSDFGVVFKLAPKTGKETVLYTFTGGPDGATPYGGVIRNKAGKLFGTTEHGGTSAFGYGTVFEVDPKTGTETVLHDFAGPDGAYPFAGLIQDSAGNFYGTTNSGGSQDWGVVFKIHL
jgi:uncharacterized repeat protein (TIGR03803 family)